MKRDQMIAHLAEAGPLDADALGKLSDAQLQALCAAQADNAEAGSEPTAADSAAATALLEEIRAEMAELRAATAPAVEEQARERESLVAELAANERCPFEEEELKAKGLAELRKLRSMARGENYAGRGGPRGTSTNAEPQYAEPVPYWKIDSDAKEG